MIIIQTIIMINIIIWVLITYCTISDWIIKNKNRVCPYCKNTEFKIERIMGLAPFNIWDDIVCLGCNERWEIHSVVDKVSIKLEEIK